MKINPSRTTYCAVYEVVNLRAKILLPLIMVIILSQGSETDLRTLGRLIQSDPPFRRFLYDKQQLQYMLNYIRSTVPVSWCLLESSPVVEQVSCCDNAEHLQYKLKQHRDAKGMTLHLCQKSAY